MKRFVSAVLLAGILLCGFCTQAVSADRFKITRVYDGDTVQAEAPGVVTYIMLVGIDAPEIADQVHSQGQPYGKEAKDFLSRLILNRTVDVVGYGAAPYPNDSIIGVIHLGDKNINLEMVKHGLAEVQRENLPKGLDIGPYLQAEKKAKAGKVGMWSLGAKYVSPKAWRLKFMHDTTGMKEK